ncbi:MAG: hypothetical protein ABJR05_14225 [Balneola sp.]
MKTIPTILFVLTLLSVPLHAQQHSFPKQSSIEIQDINVLGEAKKGDTFTLVVRYKSWVEASVNISLHIPRHANVPGKSAETRRIVRQQNLTKDAVRTEKFTIRADEVGNGL